MRIRNRVGIGLSYRPARLHRLAELIPQGINSWAPEKFKNTVSVVRTVRGGGAAVQAGAGGSGEDEWTRPSWRGHHAQHTRPCLQAIPDIYSFSFKAPGLLVFASFSFRYKLISSVVDRHRSDVFFYFLIGGKCVMILSILDSILKFSWKKLKMHVFETDTDPDRPDPDRHVMDADPDPDPTKWSGSTTLI